MNIKFDKLSYYLPEKIITNDELNIMYPAWDMGSVRNKSGVIERRVAGQKETAFDMGVKAIDSLISEYGIDINSVEGIIFCTQSPDYLIPGNSNLVHAHYKLKKNVIAFDINLACSGYVYAFSIAYSMIKSGVLKNCLLIFSDTYSKYINPEDRSVRVLFGDGAAVNFIEIGDIEDSFLIDISLGTEGVGFENFYIKNGGARNPKEIYYSNLEKKSKNSNEYIFMNGFNVWSFVNSTIPNSIKKIIENNSMSLNDIDIFIFHQASLMTIESIVKILKIDRCKVFSNIERIGNTVSASIPICLKDCFDNKIIKKGDNVLISGFGAGFSYGTIILKI